ncbi:hypothetical protein [Paracraurococcus lichenis]|uniref:Uncharacterized protein n=1 Tax=Paracraurococcus lichenis TaxID=3064888 RepID=A0ABT9DS26_9PROT|nr:hypothetical protein [Paracraurococcus sp. LOR1-02]MDO9706714.1 hypothetical protein [Paracraurococcus sp. LOR1-02]
MSHHALQRLCRPALAGLLLLCPAGAPWADPVTDLTGAFVEAYRASAAHRLEALRAEVPVLVNRFEEVALYRPGVEAPEIFAMDLRTYGQASAVAHAAATLATRLLPHGAGPLDEARRGWLDGYLRRVAAAEEALAGQRDLPEEMRRLQVDMLAEVRRAAQRIRQQDALDPALLQALGERLRPGIRQNLDWAARSQLEQFRAQVGRWKEAFPGLAWDRAAVVVIGVHQARGGNLQRQFFDWLTGDAPAREDRVVFAETLAPPPPLGQEAPEQALGLLGKVMLDKDLGRVVFGDPLALQSDVLAPAAQAVIAGWR